MSSLTLRSAELATHLARPANPFAYVSNSFSPGIMMLFMLYHGFIPAIREQLGSSSFTNWFNLFLWGKLILGHGMRALLADSAKMNPGIKRTLLNQARGKVLEVGAGTGENVKFYAQEKIDHLYCLEPFDTLRVKLEASLTLANLIKKATVIPAGLSTDHSALENAAVNASSLDTIVLVQVLCSIPNPRAHLSYLQSLLKPGGQILLYEHVGSKDPIARTVQNIWNPIWSRCAGGCEIVRDSADWLMGIGGWEAVDVQYPVAENSANLYPHVIARFVKSL
ncbi:hypothetical protein BJ742DRAFT_757853 [Cladochytrium replicatum]|nr:hypothetical protein BJ742DRAFT_757853 [Cladochytrium replicatum]